MALRNFPHTAQFKIGTPLSPRPLWVYNSSKPDESPLACEVHITALFGNTGRVEIGDNEVRAGTTLENGKTLYKKQTMILNNVDLRTWFFDGEFSTDGLKVMWITEDDNA